MELIRGTSDHEQAITQIMSKEEFELEEALTAGQQVFSSIGDCAHAGHCMWRVRGDGRCS